MPASTHRLRSLLLIQLCLVLVLISASPSHTGPQPPPTNILYGFIVANDTLTYTAPGPVYYVVGDVLVNPGVTLTIEPGVSVVFSANRDTMQGGNWQTLPELNIRGSIIAEGTSVDSIRFISTEPSPSYNWGHIGIEPGASGVFRYAVIANAHEGIDVEGAAVIEHCRMTLGSTGISGVGSSLVLRESVFSNLGGAVNGEWNTEVSGVVAIDVNSGITLRGIGSLQKCYLRGKGSGTGLWIETGISTAAPDSSYPQISEIVNFGIGVRLGRDAGVTHVLVHDNGEGIRAQVAPSTNRVNYSTVVRNSGTGIYFYDRGHVYNTIVTNNDGDGIDFYNSGYGFVNYVDSWSNTGVDFRAPTGGNTASYFPFYVDYDGGDFRLSDGSPFKVYGPWGAEIGAYGPGPGQPVQAEQTTWGRIKAERR